MGIRVIFFLFLHEDIHSGYLLKEPHQGASNEHHNICFYGEIGKISVLFLLKKKKALSRAMKILSIIYNDGPLTVSNQRLLLLFFYQMYLVVLTGIGLSRQFG